MVSLLWLISNKFLTCILNIATYTTLSFLPLLYCAPIAIWATTMQSYFSRSYNSKTFELSISVSIIITAFAKQILSSIQFCQEILANFQIMSKLILQILEHTSVVLQYMLNKINNKIVWVDISMQLAIYVDSARRHHMRFLTIKNTFYHSFIPICQMFMELMYYQKKQCTLLMNLQKVHLSTYW